MHDRQPAYIGNFTPVRRDTAASTEPGVLCGDLQAYRKTLAGPLKFSTAPRAAKPGILSPGISFGYVVYARLFASDSTSPRGSPAAPRENCEAAMKGRRLRVLALASHPVQYMAPIF